MTPDTWIKEDNIIAMMASVDPRDNSVWGHDTDIGHVDIIRKLIRKEFDEFEAHIRADERKKTLVNIRSFFQYAKESCECKVNYSFILKHLTKMIQEKKEPDEHI